MLSILSPLLSVLSLNPRFLACQCPSVVGIIYLASVPICEIRGRLDSCKHILVDALQSLRDLFVAQAHLYDSLAAVGAPAEGQCLL